MPTSCYFTAVHAC